MKCFHISTSVYVLKMQTFYLSSIHRISALINERVILFVPEFTYLIVNIEAGHADEFRDSLKLLLITVYF